MYQKAGNNVLIGAFMMVGLASTRADWASSRAGGSCVADGLLKQVRISALT
jgi:hypothetical protein